MRRLFESVLPGVVGAIALAALALLWNFTTGGGLVLWISKNLIVQLPRGAVVAFDRDDLSPSKCPSGWSPFLLARSRVLVGAGDPSEAPGDRRFDINKRPLPPYVPGDFGGEAVHQITFDELPEYSPTLMDSSDTDHPLAMGSVVPCLDGDGDCYRIRSAVVPRNRVTTTPLKVTGFGRADNQHNLMPPYVAVIYCKKDD